MDEIRQQEERVERLEHQQHLKEMGWIVREVVWRVFKNIPRIREELEKKLNVGSRSYQKLLKRYQEELTRLEAISEQMGKRDQPATFALIDEGASEPVAKQPNTYFVKGYELPSWSWLEERWEFQLSSLN